MSRKKIVTIGLVAIALIAAVFGVKWFAVARGDSIQGLSDAIATKLPASAKLKLKQDDHGGFLGQGTTFREYSISQEEADKWRNSCHAPYTSTRLDETRLWVQLKDRGMPGEQSACSVFKETLSKEIIVVIARKSLFTLTIDR